MASYTLNWYSVIGAQRETGTNALSACGVKLTVSYRTCVRRRTQRQAHSERHGGVANQAPKDAAGSSRVLDQDS